MEGCKIWDYQLDIGKFYLETQMKCTNLGAIYLKFEMFEIW
jgi:hypothetical protein